MMSENNMIHVYFDERSPGRVRGWCWIPISSEMKISVSLVSSSGKELNRQTASIFRQDLVECCNSDGKHGFDIIWDYFAGDEVLSFQFSYPEGYTNALYLLRIPSGFSWPDYEKLKIHPNDRTFRFLLNSFGATDINGAVDYYFNDGKNSAANLTKLVSERLTTKNNISLLEFACGYGCVTRHIEKEIFNCTSCDIHTEALDYVSKNFGVNVVNFDLNPSQFSLKTEFNVVFALSFFSHVPAEIFGNWLRTLYKTVKKGGLFIFTTHGNVSNDKFFKFSLNNGFRFEASEEQRDKGTTISTNTYVMTACKRYLNKPSVEWFEGYWWGHQDLYIIKK